MLKLKIENDSSISKYIPVLRKYNKALSMAEIKKRIENNEYVIEHDLYSWDICDDINNVDRNRLFRKLISDLTDKGAKLLIYNDNELITLQSLDNCLETYYEIEQEVQADIDNEVEEACNEI